MSIIGETSEVIKQRFHTAQMQSISGIGHWHDIGEELCVLADKEVEECMGHDPLQLLEQELHNALEQVVWMKIHVVHDFDEETGFCYCGWDGNA